MPTHLIDSTATGFGSFRERLQAELAARCERNPRYSLRAFARFLGLDHASLSQLLRGKRSMTESAIRRLGARIALTPQEIDHYIALGAGDASRPEIRALADDAAQVLGQWHAFAILELIRLREFRPDVRWMARVLGVPSDDIAIALQHLLRLGFLKMESAGVWRDMTGGAIHRQEDFTMLALERIAARSSELQLASARNAPDARRLHGAVTIAVAESQVPRLMALVSRFLDDVRACVSEQGADQLYHVDAHCIALSATEPPTQEERH